MPSEGRRERGDGRRSASSAVVAGLLILSLATFAAADDVRTVRASRDGAFALLSFSVPDLFDTAAEDELESGLPTRVALRIFVHAEDRSTPIWGSARSCEITYDLWDEVFHVHIKDERGESWVDTSERRDAVRLCTVLRNHRVSVAGIDPGPYVVDVVAELNPVSEDVLRGLQAWLRVSSASSAFGGEGQSFFGSFVAIFLNTRIGDADRTIRFRSEPVDL